MDGASLDLFPGGSSEPLLCRSLAYNQLLSGMLPQDWGIGGGFPSLEVLLLCGNNLTGTLPSQWSLGFAGLQKLDMSSNALQGLLIRLHLQFLLLLAKEHPCLK